LIVDTATTWTKIVGFLSVGGTEVYNEMVPEIIFDISFNYV